MLTIGNLRDPNLVGHSPLSSALLPVSGILIFFTLPRGHLDSIHHLTCPQSRSPLSLFQSTSPIFAVRPTHLTYAPAPLLMLRWIKIPPTPNSPITITPLAPFRTSFLPITALAIHQIFQSHRRRLILRALNYFHQLLLMICSQLSVTALRVLCRSRRNLDGCHILLLIQKDPLALLFSHLSFQMSLAHILTLSSPCTRISLHPPLIKDEHGISLLKLNRR